MNCSPKKEGLQVEQYEIGRYYITTESGETYLVDLQEFDGGFCSCRDFQYRHLPTLVREQEEGRTHSPGRQCKHLKALFAAIKSNTDELTKPKGEDVTVKPEEE